jgi:hypothetical protein
MQNHYDLDNQFINIQQNYINTIKHRSIKEIQATNILPPRSRHTFSVDYEECPEFA